ncbi:hypothetical protein LOAG_14286 [Loa loa]|uniref:Uncharacterized protein n=1 Tax=Loa loa TaxID=7209 RepID=A0A1I7VNR4_LOALO|nr:hypothetical protein LOAG_14286 [Loa loa]EFO14238.1 hypothetical protein LOAG_14286 [Loa loa]
MSEMSDDATVTTATATANNNTEQHDSSSSYLMVSDSTRSSSDTLSPNGEVTDKEKDLISPRKEKLCKESKKQAMGDIRNSDDPTKCVTESTVTQISNDNVNNQKPSKGLKMDAKLTETKKVEILFFSVFLN